jgi:hypothetical protein
VTVTDHLILITDRTLNVVGDPIVNWTNLDVTLRFNEPGSGLFVAPGHSWVRQQLHPGNRVVVIRDGEVLTAGPVEKWIYERSDDGENAGDGVITVHFADDLATIAGRLAYPDPALEPEAQVSDNWTFSGNAELGMRELVNDNAGPGALSARQIPQLALGTLAGVGDTIDITAAIMEPVLEVLRRAALAGGGLGFRTRQSGTQILFEVYEPPDVSAEVRFGFNLGNLKYVAYEVNAPTVTSAIVGGQGAGADRFTLERNNLGTEGAWGRLEKHIARPGNDATAELEADGDEALAEGDETARLPSNIADTPDQQFGVHYQLGSRVSIESWPGEAITDIVQTVHLQAWPTAGEVVAATVGSQAASSDPAWVQRVREIDRRVGRLERTVSSA